MSMKLKKVKRARNNKSNRNYANSAKQFRYTNVLTSQRTTAEKCNYRFTCISMDSGFYNSSNKVDNNFTNNLVCRQPDVFEMALEVENC